MAIGHRLPQRTREVVTDALGLITLLLAALSAAAVLDLSTISHAYSSLNLPPVIGVLGGDILQRYKAIINYKKLHLKLFR